MSNIKPHNRAISGWIKTARKSKKLTQKDLAIKLNISKRSLENYESGEVTVPTATAIGVYEICKVIPPFFDPQLDERDQNKDAKGGRAVEDGGGEVTAKYISLLEANIRKLEMENEDLKAYINNSSTKPKATKKK